MTDGIAAQNSSPRKRAVSGHPNAGLNPYATGGGGVTFERRVAAGYLALMLTGGSALELEGGREIVRVSFQQAPRSPVDDLNILAKRPDELEPSLELAVGVRRKLQFVPSHVDTQKLITDYIHAIRTLPDDGLEHRLALVVAGPQSDAQHLAQLADLAAKQADAASFFRLVSTPQRFDKRLVVRLRYVEQLVAAALRAIGAITADEGEVKERTWELLTHLSVRMPRVEPPDLTDWDMLTDRLRPVAFGHDVTGALLLRDRLEVLAAEYAPSAATVTLDMLRRDTRQLLADNAPWPQTWAGPVSLIASTVRAQLTELAPSDLRDRDLELRQLTQFCAGDEPYAWWQAEPWAGKTALLSWFALHLPAGVDVLTFFITSRWAGQSDSDVFTDALIEQLAPRAGELAQTSLTSRFRHENMHRLLDCVAGRYARAGRRLLLVVDGLDEDTGRAGGTNRRSVASLLPRRPSTALRVLVASRPMSELPDDVQDDHPLRRTTPRLLTASRHAGNIHAVADAELALLLNGGPLQRDILGLISASGGGLTLRDIEELTEQPTYILGELMSGSFGRSVTGRSPTASAMNHHPTEQAYLFVHETLSESARQRFGSRLAAYQDQIHAWAKRYSERRWPADTPLYLLRGYPRLLAANEDIPRLLACAADDFRHERMLTVFHSDAAAQTEIAMVQQLLLRRDDPPLSDLGLLAVQNTLLAARSSAISPQLPAVWARLHEPEKAEALAYGFGDQALRAKALAAVAQVRGEDDPGHAQILFADAIAAADCIGTAEESAEALACIAKAMNSVGHEKAFQLADRAMQVADSEDDDYVQAEILIRVADAFAEGALWDHAEAANRAIQEHPEERDVSLDHLVRKFAKAQLWDAAERLAFEVDEEDGRWRAVYVLSSALAAAGHGRRAVQLVSRVPEPSWRALTLATIAEHMASYDRDTADQLASAAHELAGTFGQGALLPALIAYAKLSGEQDPERALRLIAEAEARAGTAVNAEVRTDALAVVAVSLAGTPGVKASRLAAEACQHLTSMDDAARAMTAWRIFDKFLDAGLWDAAEQAACAVSSARGKAQLLTELADAVAAIEPDRAVRLLTDAEVAGRRGGQVQWSDLLWDQFLDALIKVRSWKQAQQLVAVTRSRHGHTERLWKLLDALAADGQQETANLVLEGVDDRTERRKLAERIAFRARSSAGRGERRSADVRTTSAEHVESVHNAGPPASDQWAAAEDRIQALEDPDRKRDATYGLAEAYAVAGRWDDAQRLACSLDEPDDRAFALTLIIPILTMANPSSTPTLVELIVREIDLIDDQYYRLDAQRNLCETLRKAHLATQAEHVARMIETSGTRARMLVGIAGILLTVDAPRAEQLTVEAERLINAINDPEERARAAAWLAESLATAGWPQKAEKVADHIELPEARALGLQKTSLALATTQCWDDAERIALKIAIPQDRAWTVHLVIQHLAHSIQTRGAADGALRARLHRLLAVSLTEVEPFESIATCVDVLPDEIAQFCEAVVPAVLKSLANREALN